MSTEAAFLAAIRAEPTDDAARLVYADWLQENGEDLRAELIRVQIELARPLPPQPATLAYDLVSSSEHVERVLAFKKATVRRAELERRERELFGVVRLAMPPGWVWGKGLLLSTPGARGDLFVRRGLGERAICSGAVWAADGDAILALHPIVNVRLTTAPTVFTVGTEVGLAYDPHQRRYDRERVRAATEKIGMAGMRHALLFALLRLRFGAEVVFKLGAGESA